MAPLLAIGSMLSFQIGMALSVSLLLVVGPSATTWLRLLGAAAFLWVLARPPLATRTAGDLASAALLGAATCGVAVFYSEAIARIPLGMATAIEFSGPLALALATSRRLMDVGCVGLAAAGVALLSLTGAGWSGDPAGIGFAAAAALCWAAYVVLTKRVSQAFQGLHGLTISLTAAALLATPFGLAQLRDTATLRDIAASVLLGALVPAVPYGLEMLALRRMSTRAFGILMSMDPAISSLVGWLVLHQSLTGQKSVGIACVVLASIGTTATRRSLA